jgi:hypothetical protein
LWEVDEGGKKEFDSGTICLVIEFQNELMSDYQRFFKFGAINKYLIESLVRPSWYFAKPDTLNDPFDCRLDLRKSFEKAASIATGVNKDRLLLVLQTVNLLESYQKKFETVGVCSFSILQGSFDEPLLWSHYADEHRGVCLLYQFPTNFINSPDKIIGMDSVKYEDDILTNWLANLSPDITEDDFIIGLTRIYLTAKSPAWKYEKEARIIRHTHGNFDIPRGYLEQVCFGLRTPKADIDVIVKLATEHSGCTKYCRIVRASSDFGITAEELHI